MIIVLRNVLSIVVEMLLVMIIVLRIILVEAELVTLKRDTLVVYGVLPLMTLVPGIALVVEMLLVIIIVPRKVAVIVLLVVIRKTSVVIVEELLVLVIIIGVLLIALVMVVVKVVIMTLGDSLVALKMLLIRTELGATEFPFLLAVDTHITSEKGDVSNR